MVPPQSFDSPLPAIDDFDDWDVGALVERKKKKQKEKQKELLEKSNRVTDERFV